MTILTFFAGTARTSVKSVCAGCIARAREDCHLVFVISEFKGAPIADPPLWKSRFGMHGSANLPRRRWIGAAICPVHCPTRCLPNATEA